MKADTPLPELHIPVFLRHRDAGRLDCVWNSEAEAPSLSSIEAAFPQESNGEVVVLGGGEPTLRSDLPLLVETFGSQSVLATDGLVFHKPETVSRLAGLGLTAIRLPLHTARADAYDWLTGIPGSHRRVRQAVQCCVENGLDVSADLTLTRPTMPYLEETVAWLLREKVSMVRFRMLRRRGQATMQYITLAPRFGLLEPALESSIQLALRHGMRVQVEGVPHCVVPRFTETCVPEVKWVVPEGVEAPEALEPSAGGCGSCQPDCMGAPADYVRLFGWTEIESSASAHSDPIHPTEPPRSGDTVESPPVRASRAPATRVVDAIIQAEQINLGGDPMAGQAPGERPSVLVVHFPAAESTRSIRKRLVQVAQEGARVLQIVGDMTHPEAHALLRETLRLSFPAVIVTADISGLATLKPQQLFHLRDLDRLCVPATEDNMVVAQRIHETAKVPVQVYGILNTAEDIAAWEGAWSDRDLPGDPLFAFNSQVPRQAVEDALAAMAPCPEKTAMETASTVDQTPLSGPPGSLAIEPDPRNPWPQLAGAGVQ